MNVANFLLLKIKCESRQIVILFFAAALMLISRKIW